ncbi:MAG: hypothetical protein ACR2J9_07230 [Gaiellales bacterium]
MRRLPSVLIACLSAFLVSVPVASAGSLGFAADEGFQAAQSANAAAVAPAQTLDAALTTLGATWVRVDVRWNTIAATQPTNARLPGNAAYSWTPVENQLAAVRRVVLSQGTPSVLLSISGTPDWARSDGGAGGSPGDPAWAPKRAAFQNFVAAVVAKYGTVAAAYEIWPSPNLQAGLRPQRLAGRLVAPGLLRVLTRVATTEIRKVTTAPVITGGLARTDPTSTVDTPSIAFLRSMARTRIQADAIGVRLVPPGGVEVPADAGNLALSDPATIIANVDAYFPNQGKGIWETGYAVASTPTDGAPIGGVSAFKAAAADPRFGVSIWNNLVDTAAAPTSGLYSASTPLDSTTQKPAWHTWVPPV